MATGIGQQLKGMMQKARHYWAELTDDEATRNRHRQEEQDDAVHQRYGGVRSPATTSRDTEKANRDHQEGSQDRGRSDAELASPAARAARSEGSQQMQAERQYAQQGGSGSQRPLGEQATDRAAQNAGTPDRERPEQSRRSPGGQQRH